MGIVSDFTGVFGVQNFKQIPDGFSRLSMFFIDIELEALLQLYRLKVLHQVGRHRVDHWLDLR